MSMEEIPAQSQPTTMDKTANVDLDIEALGQPTEKCCSGSPQLNSPLLQKGSNRSDKWSNHEQEVDDVIKKLVVKVVRSQLDQFKQSPMSKKATGLISRTSSPMLQDSGDGRIKRFQRFMAINPRKILLLFATVSSVGTMILIYFTLAINGKTGA